MQIGGHRWKRCTNTSAYLDRRRLARARRLLVIKMLTLAGGSSKYTGYCGFFEHHRRKRSAIHENFCLRMLLFFRPFTPTIPRAYENQLPLFFGLRYRGTIRIEGFPSARYVLRSIIPASPTLGDEIAGCEPTMAHDRTCRYFQKLSMNISYGDTIEDIFRFHK